MDKLVFGTGGIPNNAKAQTTQAGIDRIAELGLGCMEVEFVQGVKMGEKTAYQVGDYARKRGVALSAHAPYFINFNAVETEKLIASENRLLQTIRISSLLGCRSVVFHAGFYLNQPPEIVYNTVRTNLQSTMEKVYSEDIKLKICPEITGKESQFGSLDEVMQLCMDIRGLSPCVDFAHWHARTAKFNSYGEFEFIIDKITKKFGEQAIKDLHIHLSGIAYGRSGETKHLNLAESDMCYQEVLQMLKNKGVKGMVICESPNREEDALLLYNTYRKF